MTHPSLSCFTKVVSEDFHCVDPVFVGDARFNALCSQNNAISIIRSMIIMNHLHLHGDKGSITVGLEL